MDKKAVSSSDLKYAGLRYDGNRDRYLVFVQDRTTRPVVVGTYSDAREAESHMRRLNAEFADESSERFVPEGLAATLDGE
jgi:hypothetical protein